MTVEATWDPQHTHRRPRVNVSLLIHTERASIARELAGAAPNHTHQKALESGPLIHLNVVPLKD